MKYLVVGLGNVGHEYSLTRHNVGFMVLDQLARSRGIVFQSDRLANTALYSYRGKRICLVKPTTYMNHSGRAVRYWLDKLGLHVEQSIVVVDDISLPLGRLRIRMRGSHAGHNGLKSIETSMGTPAYPRLRVGIGRDFCPGRQAEYVLSPFTPQEQAYLPKLIDRACEVIYTFCTLGIVRTMEQYNRVVEVFPANA